jgi:maltose alpha-D-glucosyltransferase/alpha-amylase
MGLRDQWYENAIIYCLDVETYADSNGDGVGDFRGLTKRLDYLSSLGVTCIWLMPFHPSPNRDDGYDVCDYCAADPRYGTMADFVDFISEADERGLNVIVDLVPNHTSNEHPWFQAARRDKKSPYRDFYVWRDDDPGDTSDKIAFPGEQTGIWTYDEKAKAYYLHNFYDFQPHLNITNSTLRDEFRRIMGLWLQLGVSGFRIDAAPFLINLTGITADGDFKEAHQYLREMRDFVTVRSGNAILLGEVDLGYSTIADYFGGGNELQLLFNFIINRFTFLALADESADPLIHGLNELPTIPGVGQWVNFLRHHDELNLSRLTQQQRDEVLLAFGPKPDMQIYDRGLRRRLAPMLNGDQRRLQLAYSLLFSLPGTPVLFYGEEIGMGENLSLHGRLSVRTPMQWAHTQNGGFSTAPPGKLVRPVVAEGEYGYDKVNVGAQRADPQSLLNWIGRLIATRKECGEIGSGDWTMLKLGAPSVLGIRSTYDDGVVLTLNNLSREPATVELDLSEDEITMAIDLLSDKEYTPIAKSRRFRLNGYGFRWLRLGGMY